MDAYPAMNRWAISGRPLGGLVSEPGAVAMGSSTQVEFMMKVASRF
jgi:hypothetical protein